jgi:hypothetical protein
MAVVDVIGMAVVLDGGMPAPGAVDVLMSGMDLMFLLHDPSPLVE